MNNILWIEDDIPDTFTLSKNISIFAQRGYNILWARTGKEALIALKNQKFSAILLDIMLEPDCDELTPKDFPKYMGGIKIIELITNDYFAQYGNGKDSILIVISAVQDSEIVYKVKEYLGDFFENRFLFKPVSMVQILKTISNEIGEK
jgi:CheY-like chemotaxis protein